MSKFTIDLVTGNEMLLTNIDYSNDATSGLIDSMAEEQPNLGDAGNEIIFDVDTMYMDIQAVGGGDIHFYLDGEFKTLDCTTGDGEDGKARVTLQNGLDDYINFQIIYAYFSEHDNKVMLTSTSIRPQGAYLPICYVGVLSYAKTVQHGPMILQRTTEAISHNEQGSFSRVREHIRLAEGKRSWSGCETSYSGSTDNLTASVKMLSGEFYQMNKQVIGELSTDVDGYFIVDSDNEVEAVKNNSYHTNINDMKYLADGTEITVGEYVPLYVYAIGNNCPENCKLVIRTPRYSDSNLSNLLSIIDISKAPDINKTFRTVCYPVGTVILKYLGSGMFENAFTTTSEVIEWSWKTYALNIKSPNYPNNYSNNVNQTYQVTAPVGATHIQIIFYDFNTEANYDYLYLNGGTSYPSSSSYDFKYHGNLGGFGTAIINNRVASLRFTTDGSVTRKGWSSNHYKAYVPETIISTEQSIKMLDMRNKQ